MKQFICIAVLACLCVWAVPNAFANGQNPCEHRWKKFIYNECSPHTVDTDTDTHADRDTWGSGIKDELEICGTDADSTACPDHIDEVRVDTEYDFQREEGLVLLAVKHKANDLPGLFAGLLDILWIPNWFSQGE